MSAAEQPLSTLSADADTASYANLRRLVRSGAGLGTIDPGAVRIEEMLNYFDYDYAAPAEGEDFALTARAGACPWNAESELVVLGLTVGQAARRHRRRISCCWWMCRVPWGTPRSFRF